LELKTAIKISNKMAEYFVYCCGEGEHYVPLMDKLRVANTRSLLQTAVYILLRYGHSHLKQDIENVSQRSIDDLFQFIRIGNRKEVSQFHSSLSTNISRFELKKIREQERYLLELLS
jgi:hypothetical protein